MSRPSQSIQSKGEEKESSSAQRLSSNPAGLFAVPSLKDIAIDGLVEQLGGVTLLNQLAVSDSTLGEIFHPRLTDHLLLLVVERRRDKAGKLIAEEFIKVNRNLILSRGHVTDYSFRKFAKVSAWEYALWAYDRHMWTMLLKYISKDQIPLALEQLNNLEVNGITYTISETVTDPETKAEQTRERTITEPHYDFALIPALQTYMDNHGGWSGGQRIEYWCKKVGGAQRLVPVYVANYYCDSKRSFDPTPKFNEDELSRSLEFYNYDSESTVSWFPLSSSSGLGFDFAIMCGQGWVPDKLGQRVGAVGWRWGCTDAGVSAINLAAVTALYKVRQSEFTQLKQQLQNPAFESDPSPSKCLVM
jgi:hypothetical protein